MGKEWCVGKRIWHGYWYGQDLSVLAYSESDLTMVVRVCMRGRERWRGSISTQVWTQSTLLYWSSSILTLYPSVLIVNHPLSHSLSFPQCAVLEQEVVISLSPLLLPHSFSGSPILPSNRWRYCICLVVFLIYDILVFKNSLNMEPYFVSGSVCVCLWAARL